MAEGDAPTIELDVKEIVADLSEAEQPAAAEDASTEGKPKEAAESKEAKTPEGEKATEEPKETEGEEPAEGNEPEGDKPADDTKTEDQPVSERVTARKEQISTEIRDLVRTRDNLQAEVSSLIGKAYRTQTAEELVEEEGLTPEQAEVEAMKQEVQLKDYNTKVANLTFNVEVEAKQVMHDYPVYDPASPEFDKEFSDMVGTLYDEISGVKVNEKTNLIENANVLPYNIYKAFAVARESGTSTGKVEGTKSVEKMLANAEETPVVGPKTPKEDPFITGLFGNKK